jgi:hypothetical protein
MIISCKGIMLDKVSIPQFELDIGHYRFFNEPMNSSPNEPRTPRTNGNVAD